MYADMLASSLNLKKLSIKQRILKFFRISYINYFYRTHIKANAASLLYKYNFTKGLLKRYQDYRYTKKSYKGLRNSIIVKIKLKKIVNAWTNKNYNLFFKLSFLFIITSPIWLFRQINNLYAWLQAFVKSSFKSIKKLFNLVDVNKK